MRIVSGQPGKTQDEGMMRRVEEVEAQLLRVGFDVELVGLSAMSNPAEQTTVQGVSLQWLRQRNDFEFESFCKPPVQKALICS